MDELALKTFVIGDLLNNCYLVFEKKSKKGFIIDCPGKTEELDVFVRDEKIEVLFIALTHAHFDHISGLDKFSLPFYVHKKDLPFLKDSRLNGSVFFTSPVKIEKEPRIYEEGSPLEFAGRHIEIINTPGHTPGSVSLKLGRWLFSGDALFFNSIGRTDIPLANTEVLIDSIKENILTLPEDTLVYPGHGSSTTVAREVKLNPFLQ